MRNVYALSTAALIGLAIVSGSFLMVALPETAHAAEQSAFKDPNCPTVEEVVLMMTKTGETVVLLDTQSLLGVTAVKGGGRIVISTFNKKAYVVVGYEEEGCLKGPIPVAKVVPEIAL